MRKVKYSADNYCYGLSVNLYSHNDVVEYVDKAEPICATCGNRLFRLFSRCGFSGQKYTELKEREHGNIDKTK